MQQFLIKFLILSSLFSLTACSSPKSLKPLGKAKKQGITKEIFTPPFKGGFKTLLFKANLAYGDKVDFGGLLALKQTSIDNYRLIFMVVAGGTLFDFEFGKNGFVVHKALKAFDKKILLKIIEQDFSLLLAKDVLGSQGRLYIKEQTSIIRSSACKNCYFENSQEQKEPVRSHKGTKVSIHFEVYSLGVPKKITIQHHHIPLQIKMKLLKS